MMKPHPSDLESDRWLAERHSAPVNKSAVYNTCPAIREAAAKLSVRGRAAGRQSEHWRVICGVADDDGMLYLWRGGVAGGNQDKTSKPAARKCRSLVNALVTPSRRIMTNEM